ncbi:efflux RND transporter periplasmic adaptor subunit [Alicyclobacillus sp.]|uniref:HlyD family secretion protein n=1 Tax=Alicyclobacillus sp. TaxID=61169 RepID=UPI0025BF88D1|nr:efflux RND transporter periplasmic adaptor subunit [Alicyclobacillus sp.]MCL6515660.1 efflux RND transporter periplasmic adaptor subunit [Alicyclobacillus sp.]
MGLRRIILLNVVALLVILGLIYGGYTYYYNRENFVTTNNAFVEGPEYPVNVQFAGDLTAWNVKEGDTVQAGQALGKVDPRIELGQLGQAAKDPNVAAAVNRAAEIDSPTGGTITRVNATVGQMAAPGQPLAYVVDLNHLYVTANINETDVRNVDVGDAVDIHIDAYPDQTFKGTVTSIGRATNSLFSLLPAAGTASGTYTKVTQTVPVRIDLSGYGGVHLVPGMSATVQIHRSNT